MRLLVNRRFLLTMRIAFVVAAVFALIMALLPQPPYLPTDNFGDKIQHIVGFSTLAALASVAFPAMPRWQVIERLSFFGAFIEVAQSIPALGRDCDILDWVADTLAVMVVVLLVTLLLGRPERGGLRFPT